MDGVAWCTLLVLLLLLLPTAKPSLDEDDDSDEADGDFKGNPEWCSYRAMP